MNRTDLIRHALRLVAALAGVLVAVLVWGRATSEELQQRDGARRYAALPVAEQERIRPAWDDLHNQTPQRQLEVMRIHQAVSNDPRLAAKLSEFTNWWTSLKGYERDELRMLERDQMTVEISRRYADDQDRKSEITVDFSSWPFFGRLGSRFGERPRPPAGEPGEDRGLPALTLTTSQFAALMQKVVSDPQLDCDVPVLGSKLTNPEQQLLLNCLVVQESVLKADDMEQRLALLTAIQKILLNDVPDASWREQYRVRLERLTSASRWYSIMPPQLLLRSLILQLGQRLRGKIALDHETIIREFAAITDQRERQELMVRNPADAVRRIEQKVFVTQQATDSPERQLIQKFLTVEQRINEFLRSPGLIQRLFAPGGFERPGPGNRPPDGQRRDNQPRPPRDPPGRG